MSAPRIPTATVDLDAVRANVRSFAEAVSTPEPTPVLAVVKAEAYGHGALPCARAAIDAGAAWIGVADAAEGVALRAAGIEGPILAWLHSPSTSWFSTFAARLDLAVSSLGQLGQIAEAAEDARRGRHAAVVDLHVKVDTGLGRNGALERDWRPIFDMLAELEDRAAVRCRGVMSHFAGAGEAADAAQLAAFERALEAARAAGCDPEVRHIAASGAALAYPDARYDLVRLGIGAYGLSPFDREAGIAMRLALRVDAPVRAVGGRRIIDLGLVDGLPPVPAGRIALRDDRGRRWRVAEVGDMVTTLELAEPRGEASTPMPTPAEPAGTSEAAADPQDGRAEQAAPIVAVIDPASPEASADAWAAAGRTINYEIVTRFTWRIARRYEPELPAERTVVPWPPLEDPQRPRLAPLRVARIDLELAERRIRDLAARARLHRGQPWSDVVDLSADAYGHGALDLLPMIRAAGLRPLVRTVLDADEARRRGLGEVLVEAEPPASTRALYGFDPAEAAGPLMSLHTELLAIKRVGPGQGVSYGYDWVADAPTTLGLVPIGYADALPRRAGGRAQLAIGGVRVPIVGKIAMDQVVVDLGELDVWPGARVTVFGGREHDIPLREWASWCQLPPQVITATLGPRIERARRLP